MSREKWILVVLAAIYAAVGTIERESLDEAEESGVYAPGPAVEDPDLWAW